MTEIAPETMVDGRYRVLTRIGSGGMADVFVAEDQQLGRKVALKLLHRRFAEDSEFVERFRREASAAAGLQHQNVVGVYDRGRWDDTYYIAMEYLPGRSLKQVIRADAPLDPIRAIDLTIQILKAARCGHRRGIIHRDLKPHNVIVDGEDRAKVTDFGIARAGASDMTETGSIMGTAQYLSPEQAQGRAVSAQSDLYAVGVILYEMVTGHVPFEADTAVSIALKHVSEPPAPPSSWNPDVPPELESVALWALEKDAARRPPDADAFIAALQEVREHLVDGEAGQRTASFAPPPPPPVRHDRVTGSFPLADDGASTWPPEEAPPPRERRRWPWLVALLVVLLAAGGAAAYLVLKPKHRTVPNVVGQDVENASGTLRDNGFRVTVTRVASRKPVDQVLRETPAAGTKAKKGAMVVLAVSGGPGQGTVPPVAGLSQRSAEARISRAGFQPRVQMRASTLFPKGKAIGTSPPLNSQIDRGKTVTLFVSNGPPIVNLPDVTNETFDAAVGQLTAAGFGHKQIQQESATAQPGTVIAQSPKGGTPVPKGTVVTLTVAKAARPTVPNLVGRTQDDAANQLATLGLVPHFASKAVTDQTQDGKVISQQPAPGTKRTKGAHVRLVIGRFTAPPNPGGTGTTPTTP
jgi:beta-lactam-binding protein with PASTA domain